MRAPLLLLFTTVMSASAGLGLTRERAAEPLAMSASGRIAFLRDLGTDDERRRRIVTLTIPGGRERMLRLPAGYDVESFSWSANGRRFVFAAWPRGARGPWLYVVNADGSRLRKLRQVPDHSSFPVWSPRGDKIAWDNHADGQHAIWVMKADGSGARRLTPRGRFSNPTWSPDGTRIAYEHLDRPGGYVMNADGNAKRQLRRLDIQDWTPAGIAYRTPRGIGFVKPGAPAGPVVIDVDEEWEQYKFSRDGRTVVLWAKIPYSADWEIGVARIGERLRMLTDNTRHDWFPWPSPDGKSLVFEGYPPPKSGGQARGDIYVINADGTGERNLTNSPRDETRPAWAPRP